jgi:hypothetical protein
MAQLLLRWQLPLLQLQQQLPALAALGASSCWSGCNAAADAAVHSSLMAAGAATADAQVVLVPAAVSQDVARPGMKMSGSKHKPRLVLLCVLISVSRCGRLAGLLIGQICIT